MGYCCRIFTPAQPVYPAASLRDFLSGAYRSGPSRALARFCGLSFFCNAQIGARELHAHCQVEPAGERLLELAINRLGLSARAYTPILKVARTIADLDESEGIEAQHISEAIQYRSLDRQPL
jgi:magnesium chelatase family protein